MGHQRRVDSYSNVQGMSGEGGRQMFLSSLRFEETFTV